MSGGTPWPEQSVGQWREYRGKAKEGDSQGWGEGVGTVAPLIRDRTLARLASRFDFENGVTVNARLWYTKAATQ